MKISSIAIITSMFLFIGCVTPTTVVKATDTRPSLIIIRGAGWCGTFA